MKYKLRVKEIIKKISKRSQSLQDTQLMHPHREWVIGLVVGFAFFILAAFLGAYTYFKNQSIDMQAQGVESEEVIYRESLVTEVLEAIDARAKNLEKLRGIAPEIPTQPTPIATSTELIESEVTETESITPTSRIELGL